MNDVIKKVLFGGQKQASRQNDAIVEFVASYIDDKGAAYADEVVERINSSLLTTYRLAVENNGEINMTAKLFLEYTLGTQAYNLIKSGVHGDIVYHEVGNNGKVVFDFVPYTDVEPGEVPEYLQEAVSASEKWEDKEYREAMSLEDEAWELINKIVTAVPPARRAHMPENDALAAILLSQEYWKVND